jgi:hypothetical protein
VAGVLTVLAAMVAGGGDIDQPIAVLLAVLEVAVFIVLVNFTRLWCWLALHSAEALFDLRDDQMKNDVAGR